MSRRIAVILGGRSSENPISVASAASVIQALEASGNDVVMVEIDRGAGEEGVDLEAGGHSTVGDRERDRRELVIDAMRDDDDQLA